MGGPLHGQRHEICSPAPLNYHVHSGSPNVPTFALGVAGVEVQHLDYLLTGQITVDLYRYELMEEEAC